MKQRRAPTPEEHALGERLRRLREQRGLRVCDVSRKLDMSDQNWLLYEKGDNALKLLMMRPLAAALGMDTHELFEELRPVTDTVPFESRDEALLNALVTGSRLTPAPDAGISAIR